MEIVLPAVPATTRSRTIAYWLTTGLLCFGMAAGGLAQIAHAEPNVVGMQRLGYPLYMLYFLGAWKMAGVVALLLPGYRLLKEWAYAGFFFLLTGAVTSHIFSGDPLLRYIAPFIFALLTVASWYLRPASRRLAATLPARNATIA